MPARRILKPERIRAHDAAAILGVEARTVQAMAARGELPGAAKVGKLWTFDPKALKRFLPKFQESQVKVPKPPKVKRDTIYVVRCDHHVKIGFTASVEERMHALKTSHFRPLEILVTFDGDKVVEAQLHERFAEARVRGEWFILSKSIRDWLRREHKVAV